MAATDGGEMCSQIDLDDWTGIDSWIAPAASLLALIVCTFLPLPNKFKYGPFPEGSWFEPVANARSMRPKLDTALSPVTTPLSSPPPKSRVNKEDFADLALPPLPQAVP